MPDASRDGGTSAQLAPLGSAAVDAVIAAMPPDSWKALPGTPMKDACPVPLNDFACSSVIAAWGGGAYDDKRERLFVYGGGHNDSWYNNVFAFDLLSMKWSRLSEMPPGAATDPPPGWDDIRIETCSVPHAAYSCS